MSCTNCKDQHVVISEQVDCKCGCHETVDFINQPPHYADGRKHEPIDVIEDWDMGFFDGNALKYLSRWRKKGGVQDLKKARYYIDKLIEVIDRKDFRLSSHTPSSHNPFPKI